MTKVQLSFDLMRPLDEELMDKISRANGVYGIERIIIGQSLDEVTVEYDASRLNPMEVEAILHKRGVPVKPKASIEPAQPPSASAQQGS